MGHTPHFRRTPIGILLTALFAAAVWYGCEERPAEVTGPIDRVVQIQDLGPAMAVQERHTPALMSMPGVVGTATGVTADGRPVIKVYTSSDASRDLPKTLGGYPVVAEKAGPFFALVQRRCPDGSRPPCGGGGGGGDDGGGGDNTDPTSRFERPVPIGVSTGNVGECSSGTIAARVKLGAGVAALSNNHVYALENEASIGSDVLQPGRADTNCSVSGADVLGQLADFEPIVFSTDASNTVDAAIATTTTNDLAVATPSNGYGTPKSATVAATVGLRVQKYGRTTALTTGSISGINATVNVGYSNGTARFVDQIVVAGDKGGFIRAGDSGSLLVTDPGRNPVGLLFAGDRSGKTAIANRIDLVLDAFNASIDGE